MSRKAKRPTKKAAQAFAQTERIEAERRKLQLAAAVLRALVYSSDTGLDTEQASDVASVALDLVEQALGGLDSVALKRPGGAS
jgi:hypothetical protein